MISREYVYVKSHWCEKIDNLFLIHSSKSNSLVVLFPGGDGICDVPLLHYARKATLLLGCDVLSLTYGHCFTNKEFKLGDLNYNINESFNAINQCLSRGYDKIFFISKSFGALIAGEISLIIGYEKVKNLYLTPLSDALPHIVKTNSAVIVGTKDKHFTREDIDIIKENSNVTVKLFEGVGHSLEFDTDYKQSLRILEEVTSLCESFIMNY